MRTDTAATIRLKDYRAPAYTADHVSMTVRLHPTRTRVENHVTFRRAPDTPAGTPLVLDGDELQPLTVEVDGTQLPADAYTTDAASLTIPNPPATETFCTRIVVEVNPTTNRKLMGLYRSGLTYCTQCEAEGFRRITYYPDRPDVLATFDVRLEADREECPVLLSNGNPGETGDLPDGRHFAVWHDPHPKPAYLFALVAGRLDVHRDRFRTMEGRDVDLAIWVEPGKADKAAYAMDALKRSMVWDEREWGRAYDLDVFNIVAVSDFNMGAMENKGLNIFNDKYVLADDEIATDADRMNIEAIVAHEYFHNWTGNRITCRDWFQLCLKEGLTVYRDQEFSADQRSRGVQRITQVRSLKAGQFPEDAGPLAHPVRPAQYREINNFYTATVYQKGAELVRMLHTLAGDDGFRAAMDLYFERHDGDAATVEEFLACFADTTDIDTDRFLRWYEQAGTPVVTVREEWDAAAGRLRLHFDQTTPPTPGRKTKRAVPIPVRFALMDREGRHMAPAARGSVVRGDCIVLEAGTTSVTFDGLDRRPITSLLRGFSAPVRLEHRQPKAHRIVRARHDDDPYNRFAALNGWVLDWQVRAASARRRGAALPDLNGLVETLVATAFDEALEPAFRSYALTLPGIMETAREIGRNVDPEVVGKSNRVLQRALGKALGQSGLDLMEGLARREREAGGLEAVGLRALQNVLASYLVIARVAGAEPAVWRRFEKADGMNGRLPAMALLLAFAQDRSLASKASESFRQRYADEPIALDKWFSATASVPGRGALANVRRLTGDERFTLDNPNRARSVLAPFAMANPDAFHRADGRGYDFFADQILALDAFNPQIAARLLAMGGSWKLMEPGRRRHAARAWGRIARKKGLSRDVQEIVDRALG